jgi:hypothetical protein
MTHQIIPRALPRLLCSLILPLALGTLSTSAWAEEPLSDADKAKAEKLFKTQLCMSCHNTDKKLVGPGFAEVAAKYGDDPKAVDTISEHITKGGKGRWGKMAMPPQPQVQPDDVKLLARWIMSMKK